MSSDDCPVSPVMSDHSMAEHHGKERDKEAEKVVEQEKVESVTEQEEASAVEATQPPTPSVQQQVLERGRRAKESKRGLRIC